MPAAAPKPEPHAIVELVSLDKITESPHNHRTRTWGDLDGLAQSIKEKGVLQPVLLRPLKGIGSNLFELVFGARRVRASKAAGLKAVPAMIREMTDVEVIEAQIIENVNRADVHPMEEAEGYSQLLQPAGPYTVDELAAKVGKSKGYIYARMKLLALCPEARAAFYEGRLTTSTALMFARIPSKDLQKKALKELRVDDEREGQPSASWVSQELQRRFMLKLADAPFQADDVDLVKAAGACTACPKRTGAQPALFEDVGSADVCTDPACYREKVEAAWKARSAAAKAAGRKVLSTSEAKNAFDQWGRLSYKAPYVALDSTCHDDPKYRPYKKVLGKAAEAEIILAKDPSGNVRELVPKAALSKLMKAAGHSFKAGHEPARQSKEAKEANRKAKAKAELERKVQERCAVLFGAAVDARPITRELWDLVLVSASTMGGPGEEAVLKRRFGEGWEKDFDKARPKMTVEQLQSVLVEISLAEAFFTYRGLDDAEAKKLAAWAGIDVKAVRAELQAEAKTSPAPPAKGKKTVSKAAARELPRASAKDLEAELCLDCGVAAGKPSPGCEECAHPAGTKGKAGKPTVLKWRTITDGVSEHYDCELAEGAYEILPGAKPKFAWDAYWIPKGGASVALGSHTALSQAKDACLRHLGGAT